MKQQSKSFTDLELFYICLMKTSPVFRNKISLTFHHFPPPTQECKSFATERAERNEERQSWRGPHRYKPTNCCNTVLNKIIGSSVHLSHTTNECPANNPICVLTALLKKRDSQTWKALRRNTVMYEVHNNKTWVQLYMLQ